MSIDISDDAKEAARGLIFPLKVISHAASALLLKPDADKDEINQRMTGQIVGLIAATIDEARRREREACAKIVDDHPLGYISEQDHALLESFADRVAAAIRARKDSEQ